MTDILSTQRARNAKHQADWRTRHPEHKEAHRVYVNAWRAKRKALGIKRTD